VERISKRGERSPPSRTVAADPNYGFDASRQLLTIAFLSGFLVMAQEVLLQHQFAQVTINSFFSSATVLAFVLLGLVGRRLAGLAARSSYPFAVPNQPGDCARRQWSGVCARTVSVFTAAPQPSHPAL
jgi:hypothetical protein